jgi:hypothetical protein
MNISELTQQQMKEIVLNVYQKGIDSKNMEARELIDEIKQQIISVLRK